MIITEESDLHHKPAVHSHCSEFLPCGLCVVHLCCHPMCHRCDMSMNDDRCHCSLSGVMLLACHVAAGDMAPGGVNKEAGRGGATPAYLCWAQPHHHLHHCCVVAGARWWWWMGCVIDGGGGWVVSSMVVVGRKKQCGNV